MRSPCIAASASRKSRPIAPIRIPECCTWSCNYDLLDRICWKGSAMKKLCLPIFAALFTLSAFAADGKTVSYKSGDETVQAVLYTPAGKGPFPALIVIHEWWGLNDWVKDEAAKLAGEGYVALAVDLYRGKVAATPDIAHELMRGLPE